MASSAALAVGGLALLGLAVTPAVAGNAPVTVKIDATADRHAIDPAIYGISSGTTADLEALNAPINRLGGDSMSTYSWQADAANLAADYFFESYPDPSSSPAGTANSFIQASHAAAAQPLITVPMTGWVAKLGADRKLLPSFSVAKYGKQCSVDPYDHNAGDGLKPDCKTPITDNNPDDAYVTDTPKDEQGYVQYLVSKWGKAGAGGVDYYLLDNEPSLWWQTHHDIHNVGLHATRYIDFSVALAKAIKAIDPNAKIMAPEEWGWGGFLYSGYDQQYGTAHGFSNLPDMKNETDGEYYLPWMLQQWKARGHPVDVLSVHFYPQGGEYSDDVSTAMQLLRNRSTRQLWDPKYISESWIDQPVYLIPQLKSLIAADYVAGTPVAITEYNWGAEGSINGATTQADIYGIFGREGLNMATRWTVPAPSTPTYKAMLMYRNYDGNHSAFGEESVSAVAPNPDNLAVFAARRSADQAITVIAISKVLSGNTKVTFDFAHFGGGAKVTAYRLTSANKIVKVAAPAVVKAKLVVTLPPQSITLFILPPA